MLCAHPVYFTDAEIEIDPAGILHKKQTCRLFLEIGELQKHKIVDKVIMKSQ